MQNVVNINQAKSKQINWDTLLMVIAFHIATIPALYYFSWTNLLVGIGMYWLAGSLGVGLGYHRMLTHRGFKTPKWLEYTLVTLGTFAMQSGPIKWVATHRMHHAFTEEDQDPHSPRAGIFWSHVGWIFKGVSQEHDEATLQKYVPDLLKDKYYVVLQSYYVVPLIIAGILFAVFGGIPMMLWGVFASVTFGWHFTWLVNSATHIWGTKRFETTDDSTNNPLIAMLTWGEGWHNNHHANPVSARHGLAWYEIDINWIQIRTLQMLGLATKVKAISLKEEKVQQALKRAA